MPRFLSIGAASLFCILAAADVASAQQGGAWPPYNGDPSARGPGFYLAWYKLLLFALLFFAWVRTSSWVNRDSQEVGGTVGLPHTVWNPIVVFTFVVAFLLFGLLLPIFPVGFLLLVVAHVAPLGVYILQRNSRVTDDQKVLTPSHLKNVLLSLGRRKPVEKKLPHEQGPPVNFAARGAADEQQNQANLIEARQSPGYVTAKELIADALDKRADRVMLDYTAGAVGVRYEIDGVWHNAPGREREPSDVMLAALKKMAALDINERRMRQQGTIGTEYDGRKYDCRLTSQGTKTGERVLLELHDPKGHFNTLEELGMREKMREQYLEAIGGQHGFVLLSALPGGGLSTTWTVSLKSTDRLLRDFVAVQDKDKPTPYVENVDVQMYDAAGGQTPDKILPKLLLKQPDAILMPDLENGETVRILSEQVNNENRMVIASVRAKEAVEALLRVLLLKAPAQPFAEAVTAVLNQRLVRRLCDNCKQAYEPPAQLLQKLGIPQGRVAAFYREYQPPPPGQEPPRKRGEPEVCPVCNGIGYRGRVAIFELLLVDDKLRQVLVKQPKLEILRQAARQSNHRTLQQEGILLVAQGITSLNELQRVLKQ